jgi:hypothetical protein
MISKVQGKQNAQVGLIVGEAKDSLGLITKRARQLLSFWTKARKGNFAGALTELGIRDPEKFRRKYPKQSRQGRDALVDVSSFALEMKFGWEPLLSDIYQAVGTLEKQYPPEKIKAGASGSTSVHDTYSGPPTWFDDLGNSSISYQLYCKVLVNNPNEYLAKSLGLVNPVSIAWQLYPMSFVVDWFLPIGRFLDSFTDLYGCEIRDCGVNYRGIGVAFSSADGWGGAYMTSSDGFCHERTPVSTFVVPNFQDRIALPDLGLGHAITAVELLVQRWGK